ncbi:uncharacterized protein LOC141902218 [Tubulanus polymorphus]|uniref:uncharacterized protein LOC141902218 n=1 Tax=Tubulanus polymorphus TaxID=672921 RepID=UPI003DA5CB91
MFFAVLVCVIFAGVSEAAISREIGGCTADRFPDSSFNSATNRYENQTGCSMCHCSDRAGDVTCETCGRMDFVAFPCYYKDLLDSTCYLGRVTDQYSGCCSTDNRICQSSGDHTAVFNSADFAKFNQSRYSYAAKCQVPRVTDPPIASESGTG